MFVGWWRGGEGHNSIFIIVFSFLFFLGSLTCTSLDVSHVFHLAIMMAHLYISIVFRCIYFLIIAT